MARRSTPWNTVDRCESGQMPESGCPLYRLVALDGQPHPVLDAPYESIAAAEAAASRWCAGQGRSMSVVQRGIALEVQTRCGEWRTLGYPSACLLESGRGVGAP